MGYFIIISIIVTILCIGLLSCKTGIHSTNTTSQIMDTSKTYNTRSEIEEQLQNLSKKKVIIEETISAMCYEIAAPPSRAEYCCPQCGEKTLYTQDYAPFVLQELPACRSIYKSLTQLKAELDESQFCRKCSPNVEKPELCLITHYKDENSSHKYCNLTSNDLSLVSAFLNGQDIHESDYGEKAPLKDYIPRIESILGVKLKN